MPMPHHAPVQNETHERCPVCGAGIALAEVMPHPVLMGLEIHGFICESCGPVKSLVVRNRQQNSRLC